MKRVLLILVALTFITVGASAQTTKYNYHNTGYWGNVEAAGGVTLGGGSDIGISTVHGARLGQELPARRVGDGSR